jgi:hypothetical protein
VYSSYQGLGLTVSLNNNEGYDGNDQLTFEWNNNKNKNKNSNDKNKVEDILVVDNEDKDNDNNGVVITMPGSWLSKIVVGGGNKVVIEDGFTNVQEIKVSGMKSKLWGMCNQLHAGFNEIDIYVGGSDSKVVVEASSPIGMTRVTDNSSVQIKAPTVQQIHVDGRSLAEIDGNVKGGKVKGGSSLTVSGRVSGGMLTTQQSSTVTLGEGDCDAVTPKTTCKAKDQVDWIRNIDASSSDRPYVLSGTQVCDEPVPNGPTTVQSASSVNSGAAATTTTPVFGSSVLVALVLSVVVAAL